MVKSASAPHWYPISNSNLSGKARPPTEVSDVIKRMLIEKDYLLLPLLLYIQENERDRKGVSRQKVTKYMNNENLSSRVTTLNIINALLQEGILLDEGAKKYQSNLKINPEFDFHGLLVEAIRLQYNGLDSIFESVKPLIKDKSLRMQFKLDNDKNVQITFGSYKD